MELMHALASVETTLDAPPRDVIAEWLPELLDAYDETTKAVQTFHAAREKADAASTLVLLPGGRLDSRWGADALAARAADVEAADAGKTSAVGTAYAELIADRPRREGAALAYGVRAGRLVKEWNRAAPAHAKPETRKRLEDAYGAAVEAVDAAATLALEAAAATKSADDTARMRAAWEPLAEMDKVLKHWRTVRALLVWLRTTRPTPRHTVAWSDPQSSYAASELPTELSTRAHAIRDAKLREQLDRRRFTVSV